MQGRSTTDLLLLMIAGTICLILLGAAVALAVEEILHPEIDTAAEARALGNVVNTLIGLLAGFLAGRTQSAQERKKQDDPVDHE